MKFRPTIAFRIGFGLGVLILAIILSAFLGYNTLWDIRIYDQSVSESIEASMTGLSKLRENIHKSEDLVTRWIYTDRNANSHLLAKLSDIKYLEIPDIHKKLLEESIQWSVPEQEEYLALHSFLFDSLFRMVDDIISSTSPANNISPLTDKLFLISDSLAKVFNHAFSKTDYLYAGFQNSLTRAKEKIDSLYAKSGNYLLVIQIIIALAGFLIAVFSIHTLVKSLTNFKKILVEMGKGELPSTNLPEGRDEIGHMAIALNSLILNLKSLSNFSQEIGKGNYNSDFKPLSDRDILGNSLLRMREDLKNAAIEEEKRKEEDKRRNWATQGIARFSEILREYAGNFEDLTFQIISNLVKYLSASAGGLFLVKFDDHGEKFLELVAGYAFNRRKYLTRQIRIGEGLTGRAVQEGETIFMTDLPEDYIKIRSGLGEDKPRSLLIIPLKLNEEIHGVIELASLKEILPYQIEFAERICNSIASSLSTSKILPKNGDLSPLSVILSGDIPEAPDKIEHEIKKVNFIKEQLIKREKELKDRIINKKSK